MAYKNDEAVNTNSNQMNLNLNFDLTITNLRADLDEIIFNVHFIEGTKFELMSR